MFLQWIYWVLWTSIQEFTSEYSKSCFNRFSNTSRGSDQVQQSSPHTLMSLTAKTNTAIIYWGYLPCAIHAVQKSSMFPAKLNMGPFRLLHEKRGKSGTWLEYQIIWTFRYYNLSMMMGDYFPCSSNKTQNHREVPGHSRPAYFTDEKIEACWHQVFCTGYILH